MIQGIKDEISYIGDCQSTKNRVTECFLLSNSKHLTYHVEQWMKAIFKASP